MSRKLIGMSSGCLLILWLGDVTAMEIEKRLFEFSKESINVAFTGLYKCDSQISLIPNVAPRFQLAEFLQRYHRRNNLLRVRE